MTIGKAITILVEKYENAKSLDWVIDPVAFALYQTWREADKEDSVKQLIHKEFGETE